MLEQNISAGTFRSSVLGPEAKIASFCFNLTKSYPSKSNISDEEQLRSGCVLA